MDSKNGDILIYQTEDGKTKIDIKFEDKTLWLNQKQIAELFQKDVRTISEHIGNIFEDGELYRDSVIRNFRTTATDGKNYDVDFYSLDMIIAVGYRVRSHRGIQFRRWATEILHEYLLKGFAMDDNRLKSMKNYGEDYFDELLERIRDIRSSEKRFYRKVLDIYATSVDYDGNSEISQKFFKTVQNKIHYSVSGQTAAEIVFDRVDADKKNMGLTSFEGDKVRKSDVSIAKNYLDEEELQSLNLIVSAYLEFAELQARNKKPMTMQDWINKLDDFLKLSDREVLQNAGKISHKLAEEKAHNEFEKYKQLTINNEKSLAEIDFENSIKELEHITKKK